MRLLHARVHPDDEELLEQHPHPTDEEIRHYLSGNLCRCAAYPDIIEAVKLAAETAKPNP